MSTSKPSGAPPSIARARNVTAVLGPTNTGKTHLAIERMLGHQSGLIGLPLRLLAREVYDKVVVRVGARNVALITGEEKIKPPSPRYYVCTVEAMPRELRTDFLSVDEVQLAGLTTATSDHHEPSIVRCHDKSSLVEIGAVFLHRECYHE